MDTLSIAQMSLIDHAVYKALNKLGVHSQFNLYILHGLFISQGYEKDGRHFVGPYYVENVVYEDGGFIHYEIISDPVFKIYSGLTATEIREDQEKRFGI